MRQAGRKPDARALAKELARAAGLERRVALRAATNYLAGRPPDRWIVQLIRSTRGWRGLMAVLGMAGAGLVIWCLVAGLGSRGDYPWWFILLLLGLLGLNMVVWVLEPVAQLEFLDCAGCGQPRHAGAKGPCPKCGSRKYRMPRSSKVALWAISLFFIGVAGFCLVGAIQVRHKTGRPLIDAIEWLLVAALAVAGACGVRVNKILRRFSDFEFDQDFDRLSRDPRLAVRIVILIASTGLFTLAVLRLLSL